MMLNRIDSQLGTKRLFLRPMLATDLDDLLLIFTDPKVMASFGGELFTHEQMEHWLQRNLEHQNKFGYGLFSVILKENGKLIGDCGLEHCYSSSPARQRTLRWVFVQQDNTSTNDSCACWSRSSLAF